MRNGIACLVTLIGLSAVPGGERVSFEDVIKQMLGVMDSLTTNLASVRDEETASFARPELRKAAEKWQHIKKKAEGLPPPSKEEKDRLAKQYKTKLEEAQKKLFGEVGRVSAVAGGRAALLEISSVLDKKAKQ
jgi:hypothetical protein